MKRINPQVRGEIEEQYGHLLGEFGGRVPEPESELEFSRCVQLLQEAMEKGEVAAGDDPALRLQEAVFNSEDSSVLAGESEEARRREAMRDTRNKVLGGRDEHGRYGLSRSKLQGIGLTLGLLLLAGGGYAFFSSSKLPTAVETADGVTAAPENAGTAAGVDSANIDDVQDPESVFGQEPGALEGEDTQNGVVAVDGAQPDSTTGIQMNDPATVSTTPIESQTVTPVSSDGYSDPVVQPQAAVPVSPSVSDPVVVQSPPAGGQVGVVPISPVVVTPVAAGVGATPASDRPVALAGGSERPQPVVLASGSDAALAASAGSGESPLPGVVDPDAGTQPQAGGETVPVAATPARPSSQVYRREAPAAAAPSQAAPASAVVYRQARPAGTGRVYSAAGATVRPASVQASGGSSSAATPVITTAPVAGAEASSGKTDLDSQVSAAFGTGISESAPVAGAAPEQTQAAAPATQAAPARTAPASTGSAATGSTGAAGARGGVIYRDVASARSSAPLNRTVYSAREPAKTEAAAAVPKASNPYGAGSVVKAGLVLKIIVAEGGESFVVAKLESGENVIGTAKLGAGRVEMVFTRLITPAGEVGIQARGVGNDGALGVPATVLPKNPTLLQDLARSAFSGASNYFNQFTRTSTSTTFTSGGLPLVTNSAPAINLSLKDSVLSSLAGAVKLPNTEGLKFVNVAEVAVNTPLQVVFF